MRAAAGLKQAFYNREHALDENYAGPDGGRC